MIAQRVIYFFRDLLDIKATRAAAAFLRLNIDGSVSERTAAQTLGDLGAVPYTGATAPLNMGDQPITTQSLYLEGLLQIEDDTAINIATTTKGLFRAAINASVTVPTTSSGTTIALSSTNTVRAGVQVRASNAGPTITATVNAADSALIPGDQWDILAVGTGQVSVAGATTTRNKTATSTSADYQGICVTLDTIGGGTATVTVVGGVA